MARLALRTWDYAVAAIRAEAEAVRESDSDLAAAEARVADLELQLAEASAALGGAIDHAEARDREVAGLRAVVAAVEEAADELDEWDGHPSPVLGGCSPGGVVRHALSDAPSALAEGCGRCRTCDPPRPLMSRMYVCATCGNKRCPAASDCRRWQCSGSNEPGQVPVPRNPYREDGA